MTTSGNVVVFGAGVGAEFRIAANRFPRKGDSTQRSEAFSVIEYEGAAGFPGPPLHIHRTFEEAWFILDGEVAFTADGRTIAAKRGSYLYVPRGLPHTFRVVGERSPATASTFDRGRHRGGRCREGIEARSRL